jgi:hypothetical protein
MKTLVATIAAVLLFSGMAMANVGICISDCTIERGICLGQCSGDNRCMARCSEAYNRCAGRCGR